MMRRLVRLHPSRCFSTNDAGVRGKVIVISGTTGVGKSSLAHDIALQLGGEIISCDSTSVYRGMDIGSDKPSLEMRSQVPYHCVDVADPCERMTAHRWSKMARQAVQDALCNGRVPIIVGGTGFYLQWMMNFHHVDRPNHVCVDDEAIDHHTRFIQHHGWDAAHAMLRHRDAAYAEKVQRNDVRRLARALAFTHAGLALSDYGPTGGTLQDMEFDYRNFYVTFADDEEKRRTIEARCDHMIRRGLLKEVARLVACGALTPEHPGGRAVGYKETIEYILGPSSPTSPTGKSQFNEYLDRIKASSRRLAKRQLTWFRNQDEEKFWWLASGGRVSAHQLRERITMEYLKPFGAYASDLSDAMEEEVIPLKTRIVSRQMAKQLSARRVHESLERSEVEEAIRDAREDIQRARHRMAMT